ncbi:MAG: COP23 domain-containing protein [Hormoscilla sp.]
MITFSGRKFAQCLAATLMLLGVAACQNNPEGGNGGTSVVDQDTPPTPPGTITFKCVQQGGTWTTVVEAGGAGQAPVINWQTTEFGPSWTPNQRCQTVSEKLRKAVSDSGGDWNSLDLNTGKVREYTVVCVVKSGERGCTEDNMVVTLNSRNAQNPSSVLGKISDLDPASPPTPIAE